MNYVKKRRDFDPARHAAYTALMQVATDDAYANLVLPAILRERGLRPLDAAFATELTYGTLRMQGKYDSIIARSATRPLDQLDPAVAVLLRLGAHQLLTLRIAPYAAVGETVALARQVASDGPAKMINAVLRRLSERSPEEWDELLEATEGADERRAAVHSHPEWVVRALTQALKVAGRGDEIDALLEANNLPPQVCLVARPGMVEPVDLARTAARVLRTRATAGVISPYAVNIAGGDPARLHEVRGAEAAVQDEGSQMVAAVLASAPLDGPDERWLDLCAGPGGKTALLAGLAGARGVELLANEVTAHRADLVRQSVRTSTEWVEVRTGDGRELGEEKEGYFDRTLVDVPCSGLGSLRRRPEARWRRQPRDIADLAPLQRELLAAAIKATRPGGIVGYATCSPHVAETHVVVQEAIAKGLVKPLDAVEVARMVASWREDFAFGRVSDSLAGTGKAGRANEEVDCCFTPVNEAGAAAETGRQGDVVQLDGEETGLANGSAPAEEAGPDTDGHADEVGRAAASVQPAQEKAAGAEAEEPQFTAEFGQGPFLQLWPHVNGTDAMFLALLEVQ
ncbi:transcription antitermination factor NusB [Buchananella felis]|uniref:RsmB/NOP family class I SAM-dependent RNA methyltransferase n=1 Tax=Buchananella felis TaxID=3231492 RepID=UPI003529BD0F